MKILITGSDGLVGWHTRCFFHRHNQINVIECNRDQFADNRYLSEALSSCDAVIHLAGANRGEPEVVAQTNRDLAKRLTDTLTSSGATPHLLFSNSTHVDLASPYGKSKRDCGTLFRQWAEASGSCFTDFILPHIFGEHGKPFYNSVVSTFSHQLVVGENPTIQSDLSLIHI